MAFSRSGLARLGSANSDAGALWIYKTTDTAATVNTADYFLDAIDEIKLNDVMILITDTGGTPAVVISYVNANNGSTIDIADGTTISATDTD